MSTFSFGAPAGQNNAAASTSTSTSKPLFGGFSTPNPQQAGNSNTNLFGQPSANANPSVPASTGGTGMFGSQTGGGLFGSTSMTAQPQQQSQGQSGLFGSTNNQQQQQQGGLFGAQPSGGGIFGATQGTQQPGTSSGSGLFGASAGGGGLFGSTAQNQNQSQNQNQNQASSSLFGAKPGGLFGSTNTTGGLGQSTQQPSGGLFSSTTQPQQGGLFGAQSQLGGGGSFGTQPQFQQQGGAAGFGAPSQSALQQSTNPSRGALFQTAPKPEMNIEERIKNIYNAWDPNHPDCRFKYYFYNVVEPGTAGQYARPAGAADEAKWQRALRENPDPSSMIPVLATGWSDVQKRIQMQENVASVHQQIIKDITAALSKLTRDTSLASSIRVTTLQSELQSLLHRFIHVVALLSQHVSAPTRTDDNETRAKLESVKAELDGRTKRPGNSIGAGGSGTPRGKGVGGGGGGGRMIGEVNELWASVEELRRWRRLRGDTGAVGWTGDERALSDVAEVLGQQQIALQKLTELVRDDNFDADVIKQGLGMINSDR
ncbi:nucleoporin complex subunit 54-domain-containing protein [Naematelia encephala]|uniref:Nucleoporin complex subunit 54-domain-containing protein n=1 Tax=Naematelia encephala TaxID=71784 RepID=A0A1Y2B963_9TREE|nr:nucleoporin complex subunit 54-domain-containing protein [Naematelia encephala]